MNFAIWCGSFLIAEKFVMTATVASPLVGIIMGSQSDWATMQHAADTLRALGVPFEAEVISAHRTPDKLFAMQTQLVDVVFKSLLLVRVVLPTCRVCVLRKLLYRS